MLNFNIYFFLNLVSTLKWFHYHIYFFYHSLLENILLNCSHQINRSSISGADEAEVCKNQYSVLLGKFQVNNFRPLHSWLYECIWKILPKMWHIASTMLPRGFWYNLQKIRPLHSWYFVMYIVRIWFFFYLICGI